MLTPLHIYLTTTFFLAIANGIQIIAIPWLALDYLQLSSVSVGLAQAAVLLPTIALLLMGGTSVDRGAPFSQYLNTCVWLALAHLLLAAVIFQQWLSLSLLVVYGLGLGCIGAYLQPCKDYLVGSLAEDKLQVALAKQGLVQSIGQGVGMLLASLLYQQQVLWLPLTQVVLVLLAIGSLLWFRRSYMANFFTINKTNSTADFSSQGLVSGIKHCWQSMVLRSLLLIVAVSGFFHIGVFMVALPIMAKQIYIGDVGLYSLLQVLFVAGSAVTTFVIIAKGQLDAPGRRVIFSVLYAGLILFGLSYGPTTYGLMMLIFLWGVVVGVSANLGRAILQSQTAADFRGRTISVYQLALFGSAPLGALCAGVVIDWVGVLALLKYSAFVSFTVFFGLFLTRALWEVEAEQTVLPEK